METRIGGEARLFYGLGSRDLQAVGKRRLEWDSSDWKWDGDLLIASPLAPDPSTYNGRQFFPLGTGTGNATARDSSNSSSLCSDEVNPGINTGKKESEKRRRLILVDDDNLDDAVATLTLKLGGQDDYPMAESDVGNWDGTSGKKTKLTGATSNRAVCQVDDCGADLSKAKDYHRRHKVCEMHSKASRALVGNVMQRFCQQCSRFHALQEFDDGKRSCRRRLAGHNKRRRKTQPDAVVNSTHSNDNQSSAFLLISLLKILSNMHAKMNYTDDQDLLSHLLSSLSNHDGLNGDKCISGLLRESQNLLNDKPSNANSEMVSLLPANDPQGPSRPRQQNCLVPSSEIPQTKLHLNNERDEDIIIPSSQKKGVPSPTQDSYPESAQVGDSSVRSKLNNFDLNDVYIDSDDCVEDADRSPIPVDLGNVSLECPSWVQQESHQSSPPQTSGNSDSGSAQSPSSSSGEAQSRTDRIVFKLFGKEPSNFPFVLRAQILDWLSHSPTDIEGYIRPGCIVLTIYLRMPDFAWEELCYDLTSSLSRLLDVHDEETFWRTGWVYIRVQNKIAFICNGQVVVDTSLPLKNNHYSTILSVKPIAVSASERAQFTVKGFNISQPSTRILCALEGNYLAQEANDEECLDDQKEHDEFECLNFSCTIPAVTGRGLVEVEDCGLSSSSFPFIVAEKDVCSEIRTLESEIELTSTADLQGGIGKMDARNLAMDFIHEMGWLLHRTQLKSRLGHLEPNADLFSFKRFKWLIEFSMDHEWCAVVKKLLDISFVGMVGSGEHSSLILALLDIDLLHRAVRKNSRSMVELLLKYVPEKVAGGLRLEPKSPIGNDGSFLFRPDAAGPAGLTPLHIAAGRDGSDNILDALTNDPGKMGVEAWKNARDSTGFTPEDYARLRGHFSYIHLVQRKISLRTVSEHVVLNIPSRASSECSVKQKPNEGTASFQIGVARKSCGACNQKLAYGHGRRSLLYRPAMLSMVAIAAVCVCVALLFKSSPEVLYIFRPFRWEMLEFGSI